MKTVKIKIISLLLAAATLFSSVPVTVFTAEATCKLKLSSVSLTGDQSADIVAVAKANVGKTGSAVGATEHWCADFIYACAALAKIDASVIPSEGGVSVFKQALLNTGAKKVTSPKAGDIVFFGTSHAGIMADSLYCYNGNFSGKGNGEAFWKSSKVVYCKYTSTSNYKEHGAVFIRPKYINNRYTLTVNYKAGGGSISSKYYKLSSDTVYKSDGTLLKNPWYYNTPNTAGLYTAAVLGLTKTGHTFAGWKNPDGKILKEGDPSTLPSDIYPNIKNGNATVALTAVWTPNVLKISFAPGEGEIKSDKYYVKDGFIYSSSDKKKLTVSMTFTDGKKKSLFTASELGLTAENSEFSGWSITSDGKADFTADTPLGISEICPDIKTGSRELTLYPCWKTVKADPEPEILSSHTGHTEVPDTEIPSTCTKKGHTGGTHCEICGEVITPGEETEALGHEFSPEFTLDVQPTCKSKGSKSRHCIRCEETTDVTPIEKTEHTFEKKLTAATLSADGKTSEKCTFCSSEKNVVTIPKIKTVTLAKTEYVYDGNEKKPAVTVKDSKGKALKSGTDYTVSYKNNKAIGTAQAVVTFKGNYKGSKSLGFDILTENVKNITVKLSAKSATVTWSKVKGATGYKIYTYNTKTKKYTLISTVSANSFTAKNLKPNTYYSYYIKWYGTSGGKTVTASKYGVAVFTTLMEAPVYSSLTAGSGKAEPKWKKVKGAEGYEVYMASSKNGTYRKIYDTYKLSMTRTGLKKGTTYYFKIRAYKRVSGKKVYSMFSSVKGVKIK